ncbi:hypothetical protein Gotur_017784 [Gossypium turneri]
MSGDTSDSSSYFDGREPDELIRALFEKWQGTDGKTTLGLHFIDLESNKVFIKAMPPDAPSSSTAVSCGNHVYVIGGIRANDATPFGYDDVNDVFQLDLKDLERGWRKTTSMLFPRSFPHVLAAEGKIYVFECMDSESFGEVYDISADIWEPLSPPPEAIDIRILPDLGFWCTAMPVVLFTLITMIVNHGFASSKNFVPGLSQRQSWTMCCILSLIIVLWRRIICLIRNICPANGHQNFQWLHHWVALCIVWAMASLFWVGSTISIGVLSA